MPELGVTEVILSVEKAVRRDEPIGTEVPQAAEREKQKLKAMVADLGLDKRILQKVVSKKVESLPHGERWPLDNLDVADQFTPGMQADEASSQYSGLRRSRAPWEL